MLQDYRVHFISPQGEPISVEISIGDSREPGDDPETLGRLALPKTSDRSAWLYIGYEEIFDTPQPPKPPTVRMPEVRLAADIDAAPRRSRVTRLLNNELVLGLLGIIGVVLIIGIPTGSALLLVWLWGIWGFLLWLLLFMLIGGIVSFFAGPRGGMDSSTGAW